MSRCSFSYLALPKRTQVLYPRVVMQVRQVGIIACALALALPACNKEGDKKDEGASGKKPAPGASKDPNASQAPAQKQVLTVYSGRGEKLVAPVIEMFEKKTGVDVKVKYADTAQLAATLLEEGGRSPADVFLAQDASSLGLLADKKLFAKLPEKLANKVAQPFRSPQGMWIGVTGRARVLAYNTSKLKPEMLPKSAAELTDAAWKGRVGWAPENASFQSAVSAMIQLQGAEAAEAWVTAMQKNEPKAYPKNTPAVQAVGRGEVDVALVNHYYLYRLRAEMGADFPVENHYFRSGKADSLVNISGVAALQSSKKSELAHQFIDFLLSAEAQSYFVQKNYEFPVIAGVKSPIGLPEIDSLNAPVVDLAKLKDLKTTHEILRKAGALR